MPVSEMLWSFEICISWVKSVITFKFDTVYCEVPSVMVYDSNISLCHIVNETQIVPGVTNNEKCWNVS